MIQDATCKECKWWDGGSNAQGMCHRLPPQNAGIVPQMNALTRQPVPAVVASFPNVQQDGWCGEWSARIVS